MLYIADIRLWITQYLLRLNDSKTNIIYLASPHCVKSLKTPALKMGALSITPNGSVANLGVNFDQYVLRCMNVMYGKRPRVLRLLPLQHRMKRGDMKQTYNIINGIDKVDRKKFFEISSGSTTRGHGQLVVKEY